MMAEEFENTSQDTQADAAGTMMAAPFEVARQDTLTDVQQTVNDTKTTIGELNDPAGEESLVGLVKNIPASVPTGAVKSVQEIIISNDSTPKSQSDASFNNRTYKDYTISNVNPDKSVIFCSNAGTINGDNKFPCARIINQNTIRVYTTYGSDPNNDRIRNTHVQVVEFF